MSLKVLMYEMRRILLAKSYLFMLIISGAYAMFLLRTSVLRGTAGTAPYSPWSFSAYLLALSPLFCAVLLFYVARLFAKDERDAGRLTTAMPFAPSLLQLLKLSAIFAAWLLVVLMTCFICFAFYGAVFGSFASGQLLLCMLLVLVPQLLLITGIGLWLGRLHYYMCYILIALVFFITIANLMFPAWADPLGVSLLAEAQKTIPTKGIIPFAVPTQYLISRLIFSLAGISLIWLSCALTSKMGRRP